MNEVRTRLGRQLHALRRDRKLTQEQLAEQSGLSYKFIGEIERGTANPTVDTLLHLCKALGVDIVDLFGVRPSRAPAAVPHLGSEDFAYVRETIETLDQFLKERTTAPASRQRTHRARAKPRTRS